MADFRYTLNVHIGGTSLGVQWLRLRAPHAGDQGSIPGQGTMILHAASKSSHASTEDPACLNEDGRTHMLPLETRYSQINKYKKSMVGREQRKMIVHSAQRYMGSLLVRE